ncbi:COBRA, plant, partial [Sesbania bispinosa]
MTSALTYYLLVALLFGFIHHLCEGQQPEALPPAAETCNGVFISYDFIGRRKEFPRLKNVTAQSWAFKATATVLNAGSEVVKSWKLFIGFQHKEILVSATGAVLIDGGDLPASVENGTTLAGASLPDLETSIDTAESSMWACCKKDPKFKSKLPKTKFLPRQKGDLTISYDVLQVYDNNYLVQVTMENHNPLGRLDRWNLTWEWMRGEFIYNMKGAFTREVEYSGCIHGAAGEYYRDMDFSKVLNCQKHPIISDLPPEKYNDTDIGKIPFCCRNGTLLPTLMDSTQSKSVFQMQVFKVPPDMNKSAIYPPEKWKIMGVLNPDYKCGAPLRVEPSRFPEPRGLDASVITFASWQIVCNITRPTTRNTRCCVSFSAYYNESVVPCNTCACGCENTKHCNPKARAMLLPSEALLVPFENRTKKSVAWARLKHFRVPSKLPCGDNCGVSINWHVASDFKGGWSARITLFNWEPDPFQNWFTALQFKKASLGFEKVYSFNGTLLSRLNHTIFMQGVQGSNYLLGEDNGTNPKVPGKQQSVISFTKKNSPGIQIANGDGFPSK